MGLQVRIDITIRADVCRRVVRPESTRSSRGDHPSRSNVGDAHTHGRWVIVSFTQHESGADIPGNPQEILSALSDKRALEPAGEPSLQNGLTMAKGGMA